MSTPELLVVGHVARDLTKSGWRPGGAVTYAAHAAARLGVSVAVVTACGPDIDPEAIFGDIPFVAVPSAESTVMENRYTPEGRRQRVPAVASTSLTRSLVSFPYRAPV